MTRRILLIEDNRANMDLARYLLEAAGFICEEALDGEAGLLAARRSAPRLVVCDLQLPGIDGFEVMRVLRADPGLSGIPIVAVTAYAMVGDRDRIIAAGFDGYVAKPLDPRKFAAQIEAFLDAPAPHPAAHDKTIPLGQDQDG
ncbi:MAG TPA: response regulator [Ramlibacter sp.]|nr:response regulator [Ramlibacter sp.]